MYNHGTLAFAAQKTYKNIFPYTTKLSFPMVFFFLNLFIYSSKRATFDVNNERRGRDFMMFIIDME